MSAELAVVFTIYCRNYQDIKANPIQLSQLDKDRLAEGKDFFLQGKVGINTAPTEEALTVHGNVSSGAMLNLRDTS